MSLLEKLKAGKRNVKLIKFPGTDKDVAMQVLNNQELQDAAFATEDYFKKKEIAVSPITLDAYEDEKATQVLFRSLREPEDPKKPFASSAEELRKNIEKEEKDILVIAYNALEQECSPQLANMSDEDFEKLWQDLKKNPETQLSSLNTGLLRRLILYLASRPQNSQTASGSIS